MAVQITSSINSAVAPSAPVSPAPKQPVVVATPPAAPRADSVRLSLTAQVHLLRSQGQSAQQIGSSLGLSAAIVSGYLGAQAPKAAVKVEPPPAPVTATEAAPTTRVPASQVPPHP